MRVDAALSITAASVWLPPERYTLDQALASGAISERHARRAAGPVAAYAGTTNVDEMAVGAAQDTLKEGDTTPGEIDLFHYAWVHDQGEHLWCPPHQIARTLGSTTCDCVGFQQMSNGGGAALHAAASTMLLEPRVDRALVATSDNFSTLPYDRWTNSMITVVSDGATAALLTRAPGPLPVIAMASSGDATIGGGLLREGTVWQPVRHGHVLSREEWRAGARAVTTMRDLVHSTVGRALDDAGLAPEDPRIRAVLIPRMSAAMAARWLHSALPGPLHEHHILLGQDTGHIGAGDLLANLAWLLAWPGLDGGGYSILVSFGFGGSVTCVVVANGGG